MNAAGITQEQRERGYGILSQRVYDTIRPLGYGNNAHRIKALLAQVEPRQIEQHPREDVWRLYLGLPQKFGYVGISDQTPPGRTQRETFYRLQNIEHAEQRLVLTAVREQRRRKLVLNSTDGTNHEAKPLNAPYHVTDVFFRVTHKGFGVQGVMGTCALQVDTDAAGRYVSYHDVWDLDPQVMGFEVPAELMIGSPIEIYDRVHFDEHEVDRIIELENILLAMDERGQHPERTVEEIVAGMERAVWRNMLAMETHVNEVLERIGKSGNADERRLASELIKLDRRYGDHALGL